MWVWKVDKRIRKKGFSSSGTDISPTAILKARRNSKCKFYVSDILNDQLILK